MHQLFNCLSAYLFLFFFFTLIPSKSQLWRKRTLTWSCAFTSWRSACSRNVTTPLRTYSERCCIYFSVTKRAFLWMSYICLTPLPSKLHVTQCFPSSLKWDHNMSNSSWILFSQHLAFMTLEQLSCLFSTIVMVAALFKWAHLTQSVI